MANVVLQNITKRFGEIVALDDLSFEIQNSEFFVLLGPTGAGKTTTLRTIAGLEKPEAGSILFDGEVIDDLTPSERDVAMVFQQYSLYPMLTVYDNLASPLRSPMRKIPQDEVRKKVEEAAEKLRISHLLKRKASNLSGGEMQRVAIGRAIVRSPRVFLMDEPLSNLDAKLREALRIELAYLQKTQGSTTLFVTHDQVEALTMADRIGVLNKGKLLQVGTPKDIYDTPATTFVAQLVGSPHINLLEAVREDGKMNLKGSDLHIPLPRLNERIPDAFTLGVRPEDIHLDARGEFSGEVALTEPLGVETILHIRSGKVTLLSVIPGQTDKRVGDAVRFNIVRERLSYFDTDGLRLPVKMQVSLSL